MNLRRLRFAPFVLVALASAVACGSDGDAFIPSPPADGGVDAGVDARTDSGPVDGGTDTGTNDAGPDTGTGDDDDDAGADAGVAPVITTGAALPAVVAGTATTTPIVATGDAPITYAVTGGALPNGMTLSTAGVYSGTPLATGAFSFNVTATNGAGNATVTFTQTVTAPPFDAYVLRANNKLSAFATTFPAGASPQIDLVGIVPGEDLVSIDRRPQNGFLYALGFDAGAKTASLYAIDLLSTVATKVGTTGAFTTDIQGTIFGIDFNPAVDRVRVVTNAGHNFRMNPNTGAFVDGQPGAAIQRDDAINGPATIASETAYTNNQANNGGITTQYTISGASLYIQNPPNNGTLTLGKALDNVETVFGFDIPAGVNAAASNAAVAMGAGFAALKRTGASPTQLVSIDLTTGGLTTIGAFPFTGVLGLAVMNSASRPVVALANGGTSLLRFSDKAPGTVTTQAITNVAASETLVGIDYRPSTGQLYGLGVSAADDAGTLYLIDPQTGVATAVGAPGQIAFVDATTAATVQLPETGYGFDFNPAVDRVRVTNSSGLDFRVNPSTGAPVDGDPAGGSGTNTDAPIAGGGGLSGAAYTSGPTGITSEYGLDSATNSLHLVTSPNGGTLGPAIPIKLGGAALDFTSVSGFDIPSGVRVEAANAPVLAGSGYAALTVGGQAGLYSIDLVTGAATLLGAIGTGTPLVSGIAVGR